MMFIPRQLLKRIVDEAEAAWPDECCGLVAGHALPSGALVVTRAEASANLVEGDQKRRFELDPKVRFDLMRELRGGPDRVLGLYHSHPGHPAQPSARDLEDAWEPELVWIVTSVEAGQAVHTTAHVLDAEGRQFREIGLRTTDWKPYPMRDSMPGVAPPEGLPSDPPSRDKP